MALKETPKPEIMHIEDDEEAFEGGSDTNSEHKSWNKRHKRVTKKNIDIDLSKSSHKLQDLDESSVDLNSSEDCASEINLKNKEVEYANPGAIFSKNGPNEESAVDDIPMSAFESSSSTDSDSTFESVDADELNQSSARILDTPILVEEFSNRTLNAAEDAMVSLSDIPIELDQGLSQRPSEAKNGDENENGSFDKFPNAIFSGEKEVKLDDAYSDHPSVLLVKTPHARTHVQHKGLDASMKSLDAFRLNKLEAEIYMDNKIREMEIKIMPDVEYGAGNSDKNRLRSFVKEYVESESKCIKLIGIYGLFSLHLHSQSNIIII